MTPLYRFVSLALFTALLAMPANGQHSPNVLIVIADDLGLDGLGLYDIGTTLPHTPHLDSLASVGLTFDNLWSYHVCSPTRAAVMSGHNGGKTGVTGVPGTLQLSYETLFEEIAEVENGSYRSALFGKWHISGRGGGLDNPNQQGVEHYVGWNSGALDDYYLWERTENGVAAPSETYVTTHLANQAIEWLASDEAPWLLWIAHAAPHTPYHIPPDSLFTHENTNGNLNKFICMVEAFDHELGRVLDQLSPEERENTLVIVFGDNGTPGNVLQGYPAGRGKNTPYQGGIAAPMVVAGYGVSRQGERESALVNVVDIYATVLDAVGEDLPGGVYNSRSFWNLLSDRSAPTRTYNFIEFTAEPTAGFTIRDAQFKVIEYRDSVREMYDLLADPFELDDLVSKGLTVDQTSVLNDLLSEAMVRQEGWSCRDGIKNGDEEGVDCGESVCGSCVSSVGTELAPSIVDLSVLSTGDGFRIQLIGTEADHFELRLYHLDGRQVGFWEATSSDEITLPHLSAGGYTYQLKRDGVVSTGLIELGAFSH